MPPTSLAYSFPRSTRRCRRNAGGCWGGGGVAPTLWWLEVNGLRVSLWKPWSLFCLPFHLCLMRSWICQFMTRPNTRLISHYHRCTPFLTSFKSYQVATHRPVHNVVSCDAKRLPLSCAFVSRRRYPCGRFLRGGWSHLPRWCGPRWIRFGLACTRAGLCR
jgi:hypothetical protein